MDSVEVWADDGIGRSGIDTLVSFGTDSVSKIDLASSKELELCGMLEVSCTIDANDDNVSEVCGCSATNGFICVGATVSALSALSSDAFESLGVWVAGVDGVCAATAISYDGMVRGAGVIGCMEEREACEALCVPGPNVLADGVS